MYWFPSLEMLEYNSCLQRRTSPCSATAADVQLPTAAQDTCWTLHCITLSCQTTVLLIRHAVPFRSIHCTSLTARTGAHTLTTDCSRSYAERRGRSWPTPSRQEPNSLPRTAGLLASSVSNQAVVQAEAAVAPLSDTSLLPPSKEPEQRRGPLHRNGLALDAGAHALASQALSAVVSCELCSRSQAAQSVVKSRLGAVYASASDATQAV